MVSKNGQQLSYVMKCRIGLDGYWQMVPDHFCELLEYTADELKERTFEDLIHPEDYSKGASLAQRIQDGDLKEFEIEKSFQKKSGQSVLIYADGALIKNEYGDPEYVVCYIHDLSDRKRAQQKLRESEQRWQQLVKDNPQPIQVTQNAKIIFINEAGAKLYGANSTEELIGRSVYDFSDSENIAAIKERKSRLEKGKQVQEVLEHKINCLDGKERHVNIYSIPTIYEGKPTIQSVFYDVTEQKEREHQIQQSLDEKKMLLKEVHHRVKNNLAVISGLMELQIMNTDDNTTVNTLRDSQLRIQSIAMIHEKLYQSEALLGIGFDVYLKELINAISNAYESEELETEITYDLAAVDINVDQAIPCSLIVNEVIVNCYKHAFNDVEEGCIEVVSQYDDPEFSIHITDNGVGLSADFDIDKQQSLGMTLIQTLAEQLQGEISISSNGNDRGTHFALYFEKEKEE